MSIADVQYNKLLNDILENGISDEQEQVRPRWSDGKPAHTIGVVKRDFFFDNKEVPILTTKEVKWKTAIKEMLWIWQMKSNRVQDLRDLGVNIWNQWERPDGTIGKAYGYQLRQKYRQLNGEMVDQVDYLLYMLKRDKSSRRHIVQLWNPHDLDDMALTPCVYETQWFVKAGKLHMVAVARSNDTLVGNPFNVFQYNVLQRLIAQVTGYELGNFYFEMRDVHIYDRHVEAAKMQIHLPQYEAPILWINPDINEFYQFTMDDIQLQNYRHGPFIKLEVAE